MVQLPSELVTTVWPWPPLPVVTLELTLPFPEFMVTELPPVEWPDTWPLPAVTELDSVPELLALPAGRSMILQFLESASSASAGVAIKTASIDASANRGNWVEGMRHSLIRDFSPR